MNIAWLIRGAASAERSRRLMELRGVTPNGHPIWNGQETTDLVSDVRNYPVAMLKLPRRTITGARSKASRLGITRPKAREWDENEIPRLRRIYPTGSRAAIEAAFPGRTFAAVSRAANVRRIYRRPKAIVSTGSRVLDQILARATVRNVSRVELDAEACRGRNYFSKGSWRRQGFNDDYHARAASFLGGYLKADWSEVPNTMDTV